MHAFLANGKYASKRRPVPWVSTSIPLLPRHLPFQNVLKRLIAGVDQVDNQESARQARLQRIRPIRFWTRRQARTRSWSLLPTDNSLQNACHEE